MKALIIGKYFFKIAIPIDKFPIDSVEYATPTTQRKATSGLVGTSNLLSKWGVEVLASGVVGYDQFGELIKKELKNANVNVEYLETNYDITTPLFIEINNKENKDKVLFDCTPEYKRLKKYEYLNAVDCIIIDGYEVEASKYALVKFNPLISIFKMGAWTKEALELSKMVKYLICPKLLAESITGLKIDFENPKSLVNIYVALKERLKTENLIVDLEDKGILYVEGENIKMMPASNDFNDESISLFNGAFAFALSNKDSLERSIKMGLITRRIASEKNTLPSLEEVLKNLEDKPSLSE